MADFNEMEPSTSFELSNQQAVLNIDLTNICLKGATFFEDVDDRTLFIAEFTQLTTNNPHWTPIRLIRERLKLQMKIKTERMKRVKQRREQSVISSKSKKQAKEEEFYEEENDNGLFNSIHDQLLENIDRQIDNERLIKLDESKTIFARPENFIIINAGEGNCVVLDCYDLMAQNRQNMKRVEDIHFYNSGNKTTPNNSIRQSTRPNRIKHACQQCSRTFVNLDRYVQHLEQDHIEDDFGRIKEEEELNNS